MRGAGGGGQRDVEAGLGPGVCGEGGLVGVGAGVGDSEAEYVSLPWRIRSVPSCRNGSKRQPTSLGGIAGPALREDIEGTCGGSAQLKLVPGDPLVAVGGLSSSES
jgi:hypothetical protein